MNYAHIRSCILLVLIAAGIVTGVAAGTTTGTVHNQTDPSVNPIKIGVYRDGAWYVDLAGNGEAGSAANYQFVQRAGHRLSETGMGTVLPRSGSTATVLGISIRPEPEVLQPRHLIVSAQPAGRR